MMTSPTPPSGAWFFWLMIGWALVSLSISQYLIYKAGWHLKRCKEMQAEGDVLLAQIKSLHKEISNGRPRQAIGRDA